ncbi:MAG: MFS transporter, partial [Spirochaetales bacterium]|nr:MFS transporter [Candidatus Physcosoma equi]
MFSISDFLGIKKKDRNLVYNIYFLYLVSGMLANAIGSILRYLHDDAVGYGFSASFQGTLSSISQTGNFLALFLAGYLPFAIGRKNSTVILISAEVLGFLLMALTGNPYLLIAAFILVGIGRGTVSNVTNVVIGEFAENKVAGLNFLHATFAIGAVLSPMLMAAVGPERWRLPVIIISLLLLFAVILLAFSSLSNRRGTKDNEDLSFPRSLNFWMNTIMLFFYLCVEASLMSYLVSYYLYSDIFNDAASNMMASVLWLAILAGRLACAFLPARTNKKVLVLSLG